ncbi:hypothetical protein GCM10029978_120980 [Actinoallomurus acanthiterrae]
MLVAGAGQALQLPVIYRVILSEEVPPARAGVGSGADDHDPAVRRAGPRCGDPGHAVPVLVPGWGMRDALIATVLVQICGVVLTGLLSLRLPRTIA